MSFPGIFRRLFTNNGAGPLLRGDIIPPCYAVCSTAAGTAAKTVSIPGITLKTGVEITVRFSATNTAANPTLNLNSTGAKAIRYRNTAISAGYLAANRTYRFVYDGTYWQLVGDVDTNTTYTAATAAPKAPASSAAVGTSAKYAREDHVHPLQTSVSGNSGSATKLANARTILVDLASTDAETFDGTANITPGVSGTLPAARGGTGRTDGKVASLATKRTIDGVQFDGSANIHHFGTCSTAAGTAAKTVALSGFVLATGAEITVKFSATNTASSPTLNVNNTGAKAIRYKNAAVPSGYIVANKTYQLIYDGTYWQIVGDVIAELQEQIDALAQKLASPWDCIPVGIPVPVVGVKFGGSDGRRAIMPGESKARENWIICDGGSDGKGGKVPNLKGRFIYGADDDHKAGSTGGSATHTHSISGTVGETTLAEDQIASHKHAILVQTGAGAISSISGSNGAPAWVTGYSQVSGDSQPHTHSLSGVSSEGANSLPPYYAGHYVIRV